MIYAISDTHFFHRNMMKYSPTRKKIFQSCAHADEIMILNWNRSVEEWDWIIHFGDLACGKNIDTENLIKRLNGRKILIRGNHDRNTNSWYKRKGFEQVYNHSVIFNYVVFSHRPIPWKILFKYKYRNVYGHVHDNDKLFRKISKKYKCMCVEMNDFCPVSLIDVIGVYNTIKLQKQLTGNVELTEFKL